MRFLFCFGANCPFKNQMTGNDASLFSDQFKTRQNSHTLVLFALFYKNNIFLAGEIK